MADDLGSHPLRSAQPPQRAVSLDLAAAGICILVGVVLLVAGYFGISDTLNVGEQLPYIASSTVPGLALVLGGAVLVHRHEVVKTREQAAALAARLDGIIDWLASGGQSGPVNNGATMTDEPATDRPLRAQ